MHYKSVWFSALEVLYRDPSLRSARVIMARPARGDKDKGLRQELLEEGDIHSPELLRGRGKPREASVKVIVPTESR